MPNVHLTDVTIRALKAPVKGTVDFWDTKFPSFGIRVSQGGSKTFVVNIYKTRRAIGRYGVVGLSEAREQARALFAEKTLGRTRPQSMSFQTARELFLKEKRRSRRPKTVITLEDRLGRHFNFKGQLADISHQEIARRLSRLETNSQHDHALSVAKTFFTWCMNRRYIDDNPCRGLSPRGHTSRSRVLTDTELKAIWDASQTCGQFGTIVRLLILLGQRRGEIGALRPAYLDIEKGTLCLPNFLTKNSREHLLPIGALAADELLKVVTDVPSSAFIFPARGRASSPFSGWSKLKIQLDRRAGVEDWTLHDLRRTFATIHARIGTPIHIIEKLLNHVSGSFGGIVSVYQKHQYLEEMRAAQELYENEILQIIGRLTCSISSENDDG